MIDELNEYQKALKAGQREYRSCVSAGESGYVQVLDDLLPPAEQGSQENVGMMDIPASLIVGTKTAGRQFALSPSFLPLLEPGTEFCLKWLNLCQAHLNEGIQSPIDCYEYYGKFYVQEGNKRVSVLRWFGAPRISANVTRILPTDTDSPRYAVYRQFLAFFKITGLYQVQFTLPGSYAKLLAALGCDDTPWTGDQRRSFSALYTRFTDALRGQVFLGRLSEADALLVFLRYHAFRDLQKLDTATLKKELSLLQKDIRALSNPEPVAVSTVPEDSAKEPTLTNLIFSNRIAQPRIAFIHERDADTSTWTYAHEQGREYLQRIFGRQIETRAYFGAVPGENGEELIEQAAADGANVIFTTTPALIGDTIRSALHLRSVRMLNCSVDMPYPDVRTYYTRVYESKFITGAIAGAMARSGRIGYVADYPIYGVPASINAFALGARMVNPDARVSLEWSCVRRDYLDAFRSRGVTIISNRDVPAGEQPYLEYGTFLLRENGSMLPLGSPIWNWGRLYEQIVRSLMDGTWEDDPAGGQAINYWWGMQAGVIDVLLSNQLPDGVRFLAEQVRRLLQAGQLDPFGCRWTAQDGTVFDGSDHKLSAQEILHMDKLSDNVDGSIPRFDELLPMAQRMTRLQGIYKDQLPPDPEVVPT